MFGWFLSVVHASLHGILSAIVRIPLGTLLGSISTSAVVDISLVPVVSVATPLGGPQVNEPHAAGSPQHGKSVSWSNRASVSASARAAAAAALSEPISGGGVGMRLLFAEAFA